MALFDPEIPTCTLTEVQHDAGLEEQPKLVQSPVESEFAPLAPSNVRSRCNASELTDGALQSASVESRLNEEKGSASPSFDEQAWPLRNGPDKRIANDGALATLVAKAARCQSIGL